MLQPAEAAGPHQNYVEPGLDPRRDQAIASWPGATLFHTSAWSEILRRAYGFQSFLLSLDGSNGEIAGWLPLMLVNSPLTGRRLVSLPGTNLAGPISPARHAPAQLVTTAVDLARSLRCRYLELRGGGIGAPGDGLGVRELDYFGTYILDLAEFGEHNTDPFDKRARRGIAKASKSGVTVEIVDDLEAIKTFHRLNRLTRHKHGVPPQPARFFTTMWSVLRPSDALKVVQARVDGHVIASIVLLAFGETVTYGYGASDARYLKQAPNHAVFDAAIRWAAQNGYRYFDFGRTAPDNHGLADFKRQWGAAYAPLPYYYWPGAGGFVSESEASLKHRVFTSVWRRLPVRVASILGPPLYRHLV